MEEAVLGAVMLEKEAVITVLDILKPESFYKEVHQKYLKRYLIFPPGNSLWIFIQLLKSSGHAMS